jgi:osmotically-inducible protein OsmY
VLPGATLPRTFSSPDELDESEWQLQLAAEIRRAIIDHVVRFPRALTVTPEGSSMRIGGRVHDSNTRRRALEIARAVAGTTPVIDNLITVR